MLADLHIHTCFSDGTMSPEEVACEANKKDLGLIAAADHSNIGAYQQLKASCDKYNIRTITAVELDVMLDDKYLHLLAYGFDITNKAIIALVKECNDKMSHGDDTLIYNMSKVYPNIDTEDYKAYKYGLYHGARKHSNYLMNTGIISAHRDIFPLFGMYGIPLKELGLPKFDTACKIIQSAGGYAVLAHPWHSLDRGNFLNDLYKVRDAGVDGIECFHPTHTEKSSRICIDFCKRSNMLITAGSDSHGDFNKLEIGCIKVDTSSLNLGNLV